MAQQHSFEDKIQKIEKVTEKAPSSALDYEAFEPETRLSPNKERFDSLMGAPAQTGVDDVRKISTVKNSMVQEVANVGKMADQARRGSPELIVAQAREVSTKIEDIKQRLNSPNLDLKSSTQQELRNKLSHIDDSLRIALSRQGLEYTAPQAITKNQTPIERFLGLLTDSQHKMDTLSQDIERIHNNGAQLAPGTLLVLQMKVGIVQQEVEFFSGLLNKALESTKTIMNVQV